MDPMRVVRAFQVKAGEKELYDEHGTPYKEEFREMGKSEIIPFLKKMYPRTRIVIENMPDGLAYFGNFSAGRRMVGNYSFERKELWFRIYPGTKVPKK